MMRFASTTTFLSLPSPPLIKDLANALALSPYRLASCAILSKSLNALLFGLFSFALCSASRTVSSYRHQDIPPPLFLPLFSTTPNGYSLEDSTTIKSDSSSTFLCAFLTFFSHFCTLASISSSFRSKPSISRSNSLHILSDICETCSNAHKIVLFAEEELTTVSSSFSSSFAFFFSVLDFGGNDVVLVL